jgi:hypothetical protein
MSLALESFNQAVDDDDIQSLGATDVNPAKDGASERKGVYVDVDYTISHKEGTSHVSNRTTMTLFLPYELADGPGGSPVNEAVQETSLFSFARGRTLARCQRALDSVLLAPHERLSSSEDNGFSLNGEFTVRSTFGLHNTARYRLKLVVGCEPI